MSLRTVCALSFLVSVSGCSAPELDNKTATSLSTEKTESRAVTKRASNHFELTSEAEFAELMANDALVIVDFFAQWCEPCKSFAPIFEKIADEFSDVIFVKVDVDTFKNVAKKSGVQSMPTVVFYKNGVEVNRFSGAKSKSVLRKQVEGFIAA